MRFLLTFALLLFVTVTSGLQAQPVEDANASKIAIEEERQQLMRRYERSLIEIDDDLSKESVWLKSYSSYTTYLEVKKNLDTLTKRISKLSERRNAEELAGLQAKQKILTEQIGLLEGQGESPFAELLKPEELGALPSITDPFEIFTGISFIKRLNTQLDNYRQHRDELKEIVELLQKKVKIYDDVIAIGGPKKYSEAYVPLMQQLEKFETALGTADATADVYEKRIEEINLSVNEQIKEQSLKLLNIGIIILVLFVIFFLLKMVAKRYITDNERYYMANKMINFSNLTLILIIILFNYIENVGYLVTVLGFASAGIAIAMKDWFMSMLGWLVIVFGGSIHVGDRIRFVKDGMEYVGDVLDISLLRITILEDVTLTTYMVNRRAGRVVFVPNNYIFTSMIGNYSHASLKTVWDGIDITITFDSNHKKAAHIAKEIARKYSKGYTDITRKQLNKLRDRYSLKNT
ncbi:MAG: mechanosensitive ion channel, partial [Sulfurimonadaceae bacterium]|nr:mechanosensitive ion channel [Sulfurimonadaceae bacterium]